MSISRAKGLDAGHNYDNDNDDRVVMLGTSNIRICRCVGLTCDELNGEAADVLN